MTTRTMYFGRSTCQMVDPLTGTIYERDENATAPSESKYRSALLALV
jgi:hypothetical protein